MIHLNRAFFKKVISDALCMGKELPEKFTCVIDSRLIEVGDFFIALKGAHADGHDFIDAALVKGACGILMARERFESMSHLAKREDITIIAVPDVQQALLSVAAAWRAQFTYPVVGITGSVGKTSTKELLAHIIQKAGKKCIVSQGNQNTVLGIALTILRMRPEHEVAIFEMGISRRGEMARMAELACPTYAIITGVGHSHMEGLGSLMDIAGEKRDIFKFFKEDAIGIVQGDQAALAQIAYTHPIVKFGCKTINQVQARKIQVCGTTTRFILKLYGERYDVELQTNNMGRIFNTLAAAAAAYLLKIPSQIIVAAIQDPFVVARRYEQRSLKNQQGFVIDDAYNASPESMKAALLAFEKNEYKGKKIAIIGDMLELGVNSPFWHRQLGRLLRKVPSLQHVIFVGEHVKWAKKTAPLGLTCDIVPSWREAIEHLQRHLDATHLDTGSVILVKGSYGMGLSNLVEHIAS